MELVNVLSCKDYMPANVLLQWLASRCLTHTSYCHTSVQGQAGFHLEQPVNDHLVKDSAVLARMHANSITTLCICNVFQKLVYCKLPKARNPCAQTEGSTSGFHIINRQRSSSIAVLSCLK